jgi:hypothetical protein
MRCLILRLVAFVLVVGTWGEAKATVVADSVNNFSGTQGANNWYYGYYDGALTPATFKLFPNFDPNFSSNENALLWGDNGVLGGIETAAFGGPGGWYLQWAGGYWTSLWTDGGHPNQPTPGWDKQGVEQWTVRRWVSDVAGDVTISGLMASLNGGNMMVSVLVDGNKVFSQQIPSNETGYSFSTDVSLASDVDFVIAPNNGSVVNGATEFTGVVNTVPEPSSIILLGIGAISLAAYAWRRKKREKSWTPC